MKTMRIHKKKRMTEEDFKLLRVLVDKGIPNRDVAMVVGLATNTVSHMKHFKSWNEYVAFKKAAAEKLAQRMKAHQEPKPSKSNGIVKEPAVVPEPGIDFQILQQMKIVANYLGKLVELEEDKAKWRAERAAERTEKRRTGFFRS